MQTTITRRRLLLFVSGFLSLFSRASRGRNAAPTPETASVLNKHMEWMEHAFVPAAEAMPEDKFFWAPKIGEFQGVRSFAGQIVHVAELNFVLSAAILGAKPPAETDLPGHGPETMKTRSAVLKYLKDSFTFTHKALSSITEQNARLQVKHPIFDMITSLIRHPTKGKLILEYSTFQSNDNPDLKLVLCTRIHK